MECKCIRSFVGIINGVTVLFEEDDIVDLSLGDEMLDKGFFVVIEQKESKPKKAKGKK
jgi:hypothetical protein